VGFEVGALFIEPLPGLRKEAGGLEMNKPTHSRHTPQMHSVQA